MKKSYEEIDKRAIEYIKSGLSITKTAKILGVDRGRMAKRLRESGFQTPLPGGRVYSVNHSFYKSIDSEKKAYWLGFFFADGSMAKKGSNNRFVMELSLADVDKEHLKKYNSALSSNYKIEKRSTRLNEKKFISHRVTIYSKEMYQRLLSLGCRPGKTYDETIVPDMPVELRRHFIRGFFDGDGSFNTSRGKIVSLKIFAFDEKSLKNIADAISDQNDEIRMRTKKERTCWALYITRISNMQRFLDLIYEDSTEYLSRKYDKYIEFCRLNRTSKKSV